MSIESFKESIVTTLKNNIINYKSATLGQFRSKVDVMNQWDVAVGIEIAISIIESAYAALQAPSASASPSNVEISEPKK